MRVFLTGGTGFIGSEVAWRLRARGDDVRVRMIDRTGHVELIAPESAAWAATVEEIGKALRRR